MRRSLVFVLSLAFAVPALAQGPGVAGSRTPNVEFDMMTWPEVKKAMAEGKVYHDDIGQCWPAGMPLIMTRVHPFVLMQYPTAIYMISAFENSSSRFTSHELSALPRIL